MNRLFLVLLVAMGCTAKYDCEELSMKKYVGFPSAAHKFAQHCKNKKIKYTSELCQKALVDLVLLKNKSKVQEKYGERIIGCFTQEDLRRFAR